jgi:hypothetical protein
MNVLQYISELLYQHNCVIVPGFGGFIANPVSASIHPVSHTFTPPRKEILFNSSLTTNDGILAHYIAGKENISHEHALHEIYNFVTETRATLLNNKKIGITKVGTIYLDDQQNYNFKPDKETNYMLSSFGLCEFTSPSIQRKGIEKRIEKAFSESKVFRSERKKQNVFAKVAIISIPAAAVFVWGFLNIGVIQDVTTNYSNLVSLFSRSSHKEVINRPPFNFNPRLNSPFVTQNAFDVSGKYNIFQEPDTSSVIYPCLISNDKEKKDLTSISDTMQAETAIACSYYIIGSCNRDIKLAENYKNNLISKGYTNANIIEPIGKGLHKVFIDCFDNEESASQALAQIHKDENSNAWLLKM